MKSKRLSLPGLIWNWQPLKKAVTTILWLRKYLSNHKRYLTVFAAVLMQSMAPSNEWHWKYAEQIMHAPRIIIIACGNKLACRACCRIYHRRVMPYSVEVEYASEFRYRNPVIHQGDVIIAISQSGKRQTPWSPLKQPKSKARSSWVLWTLWALPLPANRIPEHTHMPAPKSASQVPKHLLHSLLF